jgi:hypothetical protein
MKRLGYGQSYIDEFNKVFTIAERKRLEVLRGILNPIYPDAGAYGITKAGPQIPYFLPTTFFGRFRKFNPEASAQLSES